MIESLTLFVIFLAFCSPAILTAVFTVENKERREKRRVRKEKTARRQQIYAARIQAQQIHDLIHKEQ